MAKKVSYQTKTPIMKILIIFIVLLLLIAWSIIPGSFLYKLISPLTHLVQSGQAQAAKAVDQLGKGQVSQHDYEALLAENVALKTELNQAKYAQEKYENLKAALHIREKYSQYEIHHGFITSRDFSSIFDLFTINLGSDQGLVVQADNSYPVVDANMNLVGRIGRIGRQSAQVLPLVGHGHVVIGRINRPDGVSVRVRGQYFTSEGSGCIVDQVPEGFDLQVGDEVVSDGNGGLFPAGLKIGTISRINLDNGEVVAQLTPYVKLQQLQDVFVLKGKLDVMPIVDSTSQTEKADTSS